MGLLFRQDIHRGCRELVEHSFCTPPLCGQIDFLSPFTLHLSPLATCTPPLRGRVSIVQDRHVLSGWSRTGQRLRPLQEGEITPVAFLHCRGPLTDLLKTESLSVRADQYHIAPEQ